MEDKERDIKEIWRYLFKDSVTKRKLIEKDNRGHYWDERRVTVIDQILHFKSAFSKGLSY